MALVMGEEADWGAGGMAADEGHRLANSVLDPVGMVDCHKDPAPDQGGFATRPWRRGFVPREGPLSEDRATHLQRELQAVAWAAPAVGDQVDFGGGDARLGQAEAGRLKGKRDVALLASGEAVFLGKGEHFAINDERSGWVVPGVDTQEAEDDRHVGGPNRGSTAS